MNVYNGLIIPNILLKWYPVYQLTIQEVIIISTLNNSKINNVRKIYIKTNIMEKDIDLIIIKLLNQKIIKTKQYKNLQNKIDMYWSVEDFMEKLYIQNIKFKQTKDFNQEKFKQICNDIEAKIKMKLFEFQVEYLKLIFMKEPEKTAQIIQNNQYYSFEKLRKVLESEN